METQPDLSGFTRSLSPAVNMRRLSLAWAKLMLATADLFSLILSVFLALSLLRLWDLHPEGALNAFLEPLILVFGITTFQSALFRARHVNRVEELRQMTITTTIIFLTLLAFNQWMSESKFPITAFALSWVFSLGAVPLTRAAARSLGIALGVWGEPVVVVGNGKLSHQIVELLLKKPASGMRPVMLVDSASPRMQDLASDRFPVPVIPLHDWQSACDFGTQVGVCTAIVVVPDLPPRMAEDFSKGEHMGFSRIITVSEQFNTRNFGLVALDFDGVVGFEEQHYELAGLEALLIRAFDLLLIILALPMIALAILGIGLAIRLDSKGSVFYRQTRIGKGAKVFKVLKFRTMVMDADKVLAKVLSENPEMRAEWEADHKLKNDPRITRVGRILRKASLDELPQLWNIVKGQMSLIGPRPIVTEEIERYGDLFKYYAQVNPGLSGLWQVSGRNDTDYTQRVKLDEYYVRNRSFWMNLFILAMTVPAVLKRNGAY